MAGVSVSVIQKIHVFSQEARIFGGESWVSCHLQLGFFGRGPSPEKEKEKHRSPKHQLRDDDICNVGKTLPSVHVLLSK